MKNMVLGIFCWTALVVLALGTMRADAYPTWDDGPGNNCAACHGNFRSSNYFSPSDGQNWGNLHNLHRQTMLSGDCNTCHGSPFVPVVLGSSNGGNGFEPIACMGCHGRNEDMGNDFLSMGRGAGLRQHHVNSGIGVCANCHSDANPANYTPVGEDVLPPYYFTPDPAHPNKPTDPCSPNGEEDYAGSPTGTDNDGDGIYDQNDPDCAPSAVCGNGILEDGEDCDDGNVLDGDCCSASCMFEAAGSACVDGDLCNGDEACDGVGTCQPGTPPDCDDGNGCTDDTCDPATGCVNTNNAAACDDGDACTTGDTCSNGACAGGAPPNCDDGNICTDDTCDPATGCVNSNNAAACDDGNACTTADTCSNGACAGGAPPNCDDGNGCTDDTCDPATGCVNTNNAAACDDGDACTTGDICSNGTCTGGTPPNCDDGMFCNGVESCDPALGCVSPGDPCASGSACNEADDTCNPGQACGNGIVEPGEQCDDGNLQDGDCCTATCMFDAAGSACVDADVCNGAETCDGAGTCQSGMPLNCDDGTLCTDDTCDPATGCVNTNNAAACDDGNACTTADTCFSGVCAGGVPPNCDDGNVCTDDTCDSATGCVNTNNTAACDDGNACTTGDACSGGVCAAGQPVSCDDGLFCNGLESCDPIMGCVSAGTPCMPEMVCNEVDDVCEFPQACGNGLLEPGEDCDDGNLMDGDCCSAACTFEAPGSSCADGNLCNGDEACDGAGACQPGTAPNCDDGNLCTDDSCDPAGGCVSVNNTAACDDGDACSTGDTCSGGVCAGGLPLDCDDGNACTDDVCDPATGCTNPNNTAACDDGDACTTGDACSGGTCVGGAPPACDDGLFCNGIEVCDALLGCISLGNACPPTMVCNEIDDTCDPAAGGQAMYTQWCGFCHGDFQIEPQVASIKVLGARSCAIEGAINGTDGYPGGVPAMQFLQGVLAPDQILAISEYLNSQPVTGMERYNTSCSGCHGMNAAGGIFDEGVRGEDAQEILEAIADEHEMQYLGCLTDSDVDMIGAYLMSLDDDDGHGDDDDDGHDDDDDGHDEDDDDDDGHNDDDDSHVGHGGHGHRGPGTGRGK